MKEKMERMNTAISSWHPVAYLLPRVNSFSTQGSVFPVRCNRIRTNIPSIRGQNRRMHKRNGCILQPGSVFRSETRLRLSRFSTRWTKLHGISKRRFRRIRLPFPSLLRAPIPVKWSFPVPARRRRLSPRSWNIFQTNYTDPLIISLFRSPPLIRVFCLISLRIRFCFLERKCHFPWKSKLSNIRFFSFKYFECN